MTMNSRERLLKVLNGQMPDRVPVSTYELVGYNSQSFENKEPSYRDLMEYIRQKTDCICMWNPGSNEQFLSSAAPVDMDIQESWDDNYKITKRTLHTPLGDITNTTKVTENIYTTWQTEHWCKSIVDVDKAMSIPYEPVSFDWSDLARIQGEVGEHGILMPTLGDPLLIAGELMEFGEFTMWVMMETEHFARTVEVIHQRNMENLKRMLEGHVADLYRIVGPEYACPPFLPPRYFAQFVTPYVKQMVDLIHAKGGKVRLHSHGKIGRVLDEILATGADATDPCEAPPDGDITLAEIKAKAGERITLFGNIQLKLLETANREEIVDFVRMSMDSAKAGGRYVIMPTAAPINVPLSEKTADNYRTYIDTALELGRY